MSRFARANRVWFIEEPVVDSDHPWMEVSRREDKLLVCRPHLTLGSEDEAQASQRVLLDELITKHCIGSFGAWYYTPLAVNFSSHLQPVAMVYDCMDELSAFRGAPPGLRQAEAELFRRADLVFTGGQSLYEAKKFQHPHVHAFPSSIDAEHFTQARENQPDPKDQMAIAHPRIGFAGVIDERLDADLLKAVAALRPEWQFVLVGPMVKIGEDDLPRAANVHYLGGKEYKNLPAYMSGWEIGMLPFARNEATRYISPTKTPEYLCAGLPVVSTSIRDVVRPYGEQQLVEIADEPLEFIAACDRLLPARNDSRRQARVNGFLAQNSWEITWSKMNRLLNAAAQSRTPQQLKTEKTIPPLIQASGDSFHD